MIPSVNAETIGDGIVFGHSNAVGLALVVDPLQLRRSCVAHAFADWLSTRRISVRSVSPASLPLDPDQIKACSLVILNVGSRPVVEVAALGLIDRVRACFVNVPFIILSDRDDPEDAKRAFQLGASGILTAGTNRDVALGAIIFVLDGGTYFPPSALLNQTLTGVRTRVRIRTGTAAQNATAPSLPVPDGDAKPASPETVADDLTDRQSEVVQLLRQGLPNKVIARRLGVTEATVKVHVRQIMRKLGASNRTQAVVRLVEKVTYASSGISAATAGGGRKL